MNDADVVLCQFEAKEIRRAFEHALKEGGGS